ncbi:MAG: HNH endonuclease [Oscillospiraceae bacterium]|nr:HNH endonuclease [Oscillospiraceae bacterium]
MMNTYLMSLSSIKWEDSVLPITALISIILFAGIFKVAKALRSPFQYPYFEMSFDVSGKRNPDIEDYIDNYLIENGFDAIEEHHNKTIAWKKECEEQIQNSILKKHRADQFAACIDDDNAYRFSLCRDQTRYRQTNYVKEPYKVSVTFYDDSFDYEWLLSRYQQLQAINFEATLSDYHKKAQRKLMSKQLRDRIAERDHYTCRICGKHMPDGVGLQIDHIVPVSKGGKSVPSNLQVLCSKCNGAKKARIIRSSMSTQ